MSSLIAEFEQDSINLFDRIQRRENGCYGRHLCCYNNPGFTYVHIGDNRRSSRRDSEMAARIMIGTIAAIAIGVGFFQMAEGTRRVNGAKSELNYLKDIGSEVTEVPRLKTLHEGRVKITNTIRSRAIADIALATFLYVGASFALVGATAASEAFVVSGIVIGGSALLSSGIKSLIEYARRDILTISEETLQNYQRACGRIE